MKRYKCEKCGGTIYIKEKNKNYDMKVKILNKFEKEFSGYGKDGTKWSVTDTKFEKFKDKLREKK